MMICVKLAKICLNWPNGFGEIISNIGKVILLLFPVRK